MQEGEAAFLDQILRAREHLFGLGRKAGDDVGAERDVRPQPPHLRAELNRIVARMPPLHPLQDQIVAGLQRQMQMRHQPLVVRDHVEQIAIDLDRSIDEIRNRFNSGTCRRICLVSMPSFGAPGRSAP